MNIGFLMQMPSGLQKMIMIELNIKTLKVSFGNKTLKVSITNYHLGCQKSLAISRDD